jgi:DNA recombination-mediator protein A
MNDVSVAIIGTRNPTPWQRDCAYHLAQQLSQKGIRIRTGAAYGVDEAAMYGSLINMLDVYLPWASYNAGIIPVGCNITVYNKWEHTTWTESVAKYHPAPERLGGATNLHARNYGIIADPIPVHMVIAFPTTRDSGGTGQGIRIANGLGLMVRQLVATCNIPKENILRDVENDLFAIGETLRQPPDEDPMANVEQWGEYHG